jgi:ParB family transcriptional regulator, chromosome partitioning protein
VSAATRPGARRGLGMGLSALLGGGAAEAYAGDGAAAPAPQRVPIEFLRPSPLQPRRRFDEAELEALAGSVRERGVLQPLLVRPCDRGAAGYEIVAGERRWRAAQRAGLHEVPVVVRELSDRDTLEVALVENLQRADLSPLEEAQAYRRLMDEFAHTQEEMAEAVGRSRSHVANTVRLLSLPAVVQDMVADGRLSAGHARALVGSPAAESLASAVVERGLNVRETEALVRREAGRPRPGGRSAGRADPNALELARRLTGQLGLEVDIRARGRGGLLTIRYSDLDQLDGLIRRLQ